MKQISTQLAHNSSTMRTVLTPMNTHVSIYRCIFTCRPYFSDTICLTIRWLDALADHLRPRTCQTQQLQFGDSGAFVSVYFALSPTLNEPHSFKILYPYVHSILCCPYIERSQVRPGRCPIRASISVAGRKSNQICTYRWKTCSTIRGAILVPD